MSALDLMHALVVDDGRRWGEAAVDWQREDARAVLEPGPADARLHWLGRPKGGSKTTDLAGMSIAWLIEQAPALAEGFAAASDRDQAARLLRRAKGFISRTEGLGSVLEVQANKIVHRSSGATVEALAADVAGSEGLLSPWIVVDGFPNWADTPTAKGLWLSLFSGIEKVPGCRFVVIGHAGDPSHWSRKVLDDASAELGWRVVEVPGPLPWITPEGLERQRRSLLPSQFARRHLNAWTAAEDRLSTVEGVRACVRHAGPLPHVEGFRYVVGVDLGVKSDRTVASVCHLEREDDGVTVVLDRMQVWTPSPGRQVDLEDVEAWLMEAHRGFGSPRIVVDPWQALSMIQRLRARGVRIEEFTFSQASIGRLALTLWSLLRDTRLELPDDDELVAELAAVQLRETSPGVYRMDHSSSGHDDRAVSLALASWALLNKGAASKRHRIVRVNDIDMSDDAAPDPVAEQIKAWVESDPTPTEAAMRAWLRGSP